MPLKSLVLQGYKTFAGRTTFELADRVTCIVGPNGSGKSNIADAIRWVLGEQSYGLLRGKKTADMIFHGSEQRARAGMASVEIVFDNSNGWLPVEFSEVSIGRRAYRDGSNEYLINGQKVRLKDVLELLGNSGLSERTYTIIGQGLVDSALSLRADERRRLFEEAAGIGLYRSRREEAKRRLEHTRRNLERVEDILSELKPRLRSLERQAERARQYEQVRADLQLLLRDWYGYHWNRAMHELGAARQNAREQVRELETVRARQAELERQMAEFRAHLHGVRSRLGSWHREMAQLHSRREVIARQLAVVDERLRSLEGQLRESQDALQRSEQQIEAAGERLLEAEAESRRLRQELEEAQERAAVARAALEERQRAREQAAARIRAAEESVQTMLERQAAARARLEESRLQAERQQVELAQLESAVADAAAVLKTAAARQREAEEAVRRARAAREDAEAALARQRETIAQAEAERAESLEALNVTRARLTGLEAQLQVLEQAEAALSGYASGTQVVLKSAQRGDVRGARGALSSHLQVPAELETAIAAALGEFLDAVVLQEDEAVEAALEALLASSARGALLPLTNLAAADPLKATAGDGVIGVASALVEAPPELRPAVDLLLGQTVVVEDRAAARRWLAAQPQGARAVTLRGEVFVARGPVLTGAPGAASTLSRPRQRKELQAEIRAARAEMEKQQAELDRLERRLSDLRGEQQQAESRLDETGRELALAERSRREAELEQAQAQRQLDWQRKQQDDLQAALQAGEAEAQRMQAELVDLEAKLAQAESELRTLRAAVSAISLEEDQLQVSHWNTQVLVAQQALDHAREREVERRQAQAQERAAHQALQARIASLQGEVTRLEEEKENLRQGEMDVLSKVEVLQALIEPAEAELASAETRQEELLAEESRLRKQLSAADQRHSRAELTLARKQEALDRWRERIEGDFGLVSLTYSDSVSGPTPLPLGDFVEQLPTVEELPAGMGDTIKQMRAQLRRIGAVNPEAQQEYQEVSERYNFITSQVEDLHRAQADIREVIAELDALMEREFKTTFDAVAKEFRQIFTRLFGGGSAQLVLTNPDDMTDTGIEIEARLPGRRTQGLSLLSGGERSLTATALVFALLKVSPTPFCVLDEVDAMLDEANVGRFRDLLLELSENTQFIVITHNRNTVQAADVIYGITMGRDSASQVISLKLDEVAEVVS